MVLDVSKGSKLPDDHETDPWVAAFICELHMVFGTPVSSSACTSKEEKILYIWARFGIAHALSLQEDLWRSMRKKVTPDVAADAFTKRYFQLTDKMIVEPMPVFSPRGETRGPLALTGKVGK